MFGFMALLGYSQKSSIENNFIVTVNCTCWGSNTLSINQEASTYGLLINGATDIGDLCIRFISGRYANIQKLDCVTDIEADGVVSIAA